MRCLSCNQRLSSREATRKYASNEATFVDLCNKCFAHVAEDIPDVESNVVADFNDGDIEDAISKWNAGEEDYQLFRDSDD